MAAADEEVDPALWTPTPVLVELVRKVTRGFYGPMHALIVQHLLIKDSIREEEFFQLLKLHKQQVMVWIGELLTAKILGQDTRDDKPVAEGVILTDYQKRQRKLTTYYYIDYLGLVNGVRYRLLEIPRRLEKLAKQKSDNQKYRCPECESEFNALEHIAQLIDPESGELLCTACRVPVEEIHKKNAINENSVSRFHQQMHEISRLLEAAPANIPARALNAAVSTEETVDSGIAATRQAALAAANAGVQRKGRSLDLNFLANATFDVRLVPNADAQVPDSVRDGALPPYCASYLLTNSMARQYAAEEKLDDSIETEDESELLSPEMGTEIPDASDTQCSVRVQGQLVPLSDITAAHEANMTEDEYNQYFQTAITNRINFFRILEEKEKASRYSDDDVNLDSDEGEDALL